MNHGILITELSPKKQSSAGMRKECKSQPAGLSTVQDAWQSHDLAERKKFWNPKDWTDYLPWEWPIVSVTKTHTKELNSFQYFSHLT